MGIQGQKPTRRLHIKDNIPDSQWCDVRMEYIKEDKTVAQIAKERGCEARAVSRLIKENRNFSELGKKRTPYRMDGYQEDVERLLKSSPFFGMSHITLVSQALINKLRPMGYLGSERTLRDYLQTVPWQEWVR